MSTDSVHDRLEDKLAKDDAVSGLEIVRFGLAMVVLTIYTWLSAIRIFAERAVRRTGSVLLAVAFLFVSVVIYRGLMAGYSRFVALVVERAIERASEEDSISDRASIAIGVAIGLGFTYLLYRVAEWAVRPYIERVKEHQEMQKAADMAGIDLGDDEEENEDGDTITTHD